MEVVRFWFNRFRKLLVRLEKANRLRDTLMQKLSVLELLALDRKTIVKPPSWNLPEQLAIANHYFKIATGSNAIEYCRRSGAAISSGEIEFDFLLFGP